MYEKIFEIMKKIVKNKIKFIKNKNIYLFFMKFESYKYVFIGNIHEILILINEISNCEIPGFFKISRRE